MQWNYQLSDILVSDGGGSCWIMHEPFHAVDPHKVLRNGCTWKLCCLFAIDFDSLRAVCWPSPLFMATIN